jgi:hypothetical protein
LDIFLTIRDGDRMYVKVKFNRPVGTFEVAGDVFQWRLGGVRARQLQLLPGRWY